MLVTYIGGPMDHRIETRMDLKTEADVRKAVQLPSYSYSGSITSRGDVVEAVFVHARATKYDYDSREAELNRRANRASRIF